MLEDNDFLLDSYSAFARLAKEDDGKKLLEYLKAQKQFYDSVQNINKTNKLEVVGSEAIANARVVDFINEIIDTIQTAEGLIDDIVSINKNKKDNYG